MGVADKLGVVVVMKGSNSFVVSPSNAWCYEGGAVGLATSGSGDVLAGIITGLAARGASATDAALWGVFLHGEAGVQLSKTIGPLGTWLARYQAAYQGSLSRASTGTYRSAASS